MLFEIGARMFGQVPTPERIIAHRPPLVLGLGSLYGAIEWFGKIDAQLRALLNIQVATLYEACSTEWTSVAVGVKVSVPAEKVDSVGLMRRARIFSDRERAALEFCERITRDDLEVSDECFVRLQKAFQGSRDRRADLHHRIPDVREQICEGVRT